MRRVAATCVALCLLLTAPAAQARTFLFQVERAGHGLYLLGSIHAARPETYPLDQSLERAFADSDLLVVEVDVEKADPAVMADLVREQGLYPENDGLSAHMRPETLELFRSLGRDPASYETMRPWLAIMTMEVAEFMELGYDPALGVDMHFLGEARQRSMAVEELETVERQINLLARLSAGDEDAFLFHSLRQLAVLGRVMAEMTALWAAGDKEGLETLIFGELYDPACEDFYQTLLYERNLAMTARVESLLDRGDRAFVVVGAAHLLGERGILALLRQRGCEVTQQ